MFGNFIYILIVLLIYLTYQPTEAPPFSKVYSVALLLGLALVFNTFVAQQFKRIARKAAQSPYAWIDRQFDTTVTRLSIAAIALFAVDIYGLNLTSLFAALPVIARIPTLQGLLCVALFLLYLSLVWYHAHGCQQLLGRTAISRGAYIRSNLLFHIPIIFPWLVLSSVADLIQILPWETPKRFLTTMTGEIAYFLVLLFVISFFGPALIQRFWRCRPLESGVIRQRIESLCQRASMDYANILYWPIFGGRMITAGVMGIFARFRYLLVTKALLESLAPQEIDAVMAHEIGHVKKRHLLFYIFLFSGYMLIAFATFDLIILMIIYAKPLYGFIEAIGLSQASAASALFSLTIIFIFFSYFRYVFGYFMRNFERQADTYVYTLFPSARPLISTLEKIGFSSGQPPEKPNWHHFSISQRIAYLQHCEHDRSWIARHDAKIRKSIAVYTAALALIAALGYHLNYGEAGRRISQHFIKAIIERESAKNPHDADLLASLGDLYFDDKRYVQAAEAYESALALAPGNVHVLNNLAWLYATCDQQRMRRPRRALELAQQAAAASHSPHIFDTLAECYYANAMLAQAVAAAESALHLADENQAYYRQQLEKFKSALQKLREGRGGSSGAFTSKLPCGPESNRCDHQISC